jgi:hypothetical protein
MTKVPIGEINEFNKSYPYNKMKRKHGERNK